MKLSFNSWSRERILDGRKSLTSRKHNYYYDERVDYVIGALPWKFIRTFLYRDEGASSPAELQKVIEDIFKREVKDDEMFYVHILK